MSKIIVGVSDEHSTRAASESLFSNGLDGADSAEKQKQSTGGQPSYDRTSAARWFIALGVVAVLSIGASYFISINMLGQHIFTQSASMVRLAVAKDLELCTWINNLGGIYVPATDKTPPNPLLESAGREVLTPEGVLLTKVNPAYLIRLLHESRSDPSGMGAHLVSLNPMLPDSKIEPWEKQVLSDLISSGAEEYVEMVDDGGVLYTRYMLPLEAKRECLSCHGDLGYTEGDIIGGVSSSILTFESTIEHASVHSILLWGHVGACLMIVALIGMAGRAITRRGKERDVAEARLKELAATLEERVEQRSRDLQTYTAQTDHILSSTLEGIVLVDDNAAILFINKTGQELTGYRAGDSLDQAFAHCPEEPCSCPLCQAENGNLRTRFTSVSMLCRDGNSIFVDGSTSPMLDDGERIGMILVFHNISEYSKVESLQRLIFGVSVEPFLIFTGQTVTSCNEAAVQFLGAASEEDVLNNFFAFSPLRQQNGRLTSEMLSVYLEKCDRMGTATFPWMHLHSTGEMLPCSITLSKIDHPMHHGYFVSIFDMRGILAYEQKLTADRQLLSDIVSASPMPMYIVDDTGTVCIINPAGTMLLGLSPGQGGDLPWEEKTTYFGMLDDVRHGKEIQGQACRLYGSEKGTLLETLVNMITVTIDGKQATLIWIQDISDFVAARNLAEESAKAKGEFLARMSHEIRTPMNAILGMTYLFLQKPLEDWQQRYILKIQMAAKGLLGIINDILDYSKLEAGKMMLDVAPFNFSDMLESLSNVCSPMADAKKLELLFYVEPELPDEFEGDALRLSQVLTNLLSNAIKFTEQGEVVLRITQTKQEGDLYTVSMAVTDSGIGLNSEQLERLFYSFEQADVSTTRRYGGTGLGLPISEQLVRMMGGEITVSSLPDHGSTFSFSVDLRSCKAKQEHSYTNLVEKERILLVDDNKTARKVLGDTLTAFGFEVDSASSGEEACAAVASSAENGALYCAVLLDWNMPGMDSFECARQMYAQAIAAAPQQLSTDALPQLMMISAQAMEELNGQDSFPDFLTYVTKPVTRASLWNALAGLLCKRSLKKRDASIPYGSQELGMDRLRGAHILLVEDNEINQEVAGSLLKRCGLRVTVANNGLEAVNLCKEQRFDLIFMDIQMPVMDGLDAARAIRRQEEGGEKSTPIVAMTAHAMQSDRQISLQAGMNDHITKPIDPETLSATLLKWGRPVKESALPFEAKEKREGQDLPD